MRVAAPGVESVYASGGSPSAARAGSSAPRSCCTSTARMGVPAFALFVHTAVVSWASVCTAATALPPVVNDGVPEPESS